jgi:hypothetical protein
VGNTQAVRYLPVLKRHGTKKKGRMGTVEEGRGKRGVIDELNELITGRKRDFSLKD